MPVPGLSLPLIMNPFIRLSQEASRKEKMVLKEGEDGETDLTVWANE